MSDERLLSRIGAAARSPIPGTIIYVVQLDDLDGGTEVHAVFDNEDMADDYANELNMTDDHSVANILPFMLNPKGR